MEEMSPEELERGGYVYRVRSLDGDDLGLVTHGAPSVSVGDVVLVDGRLCEVTRCLDIPGVRRVLEVRPLAS